VNVVRKLRVSIHPDIVNKELANERLRVLGWQNRELTIEELIESIKQGRPYCAQLNGYRDAKHFIASDVASADVDHGPTIEEAMQNPLVRDHAAFLYTTVRHQPKAHRYRVVFVLPRTITDATEMAALLRGIRLRVSGDPNSLDAARMFYGNTNAEVTFLGHELSAALLDELIAQGQNPPESDLAGSTGSAPSRSALRITPDQQVRLAKGGVLRFSEIVPRTIVHCPFHPDRHPSAFVVSNNDGVKGIHCSACHCTYWPQDVPLQGDEALESFDRTVRKAANYLKTHQNYGPLGPLFGVPDAPAELNASLAISIVDGQATPPALLPGHVMVKSGKGTGKTRNLTRLLGNAQSVLLIGHRRALIRHTCERLHLHCYLDGANEASVERHHRYGICLDSLTKIPSHVRFDVLVLDESEQVLAHFLSETMDRGGGSRDRVFVEFRRLVRQTETVIALDADLAWVTFRTLSRLDPAKQTYIWLNDAKPSEGKKIKLFDSQQHLIAELKQALADGKRCFVTSNAKTKVTALAAALADEFCHKKFIVITADTGGQERVKKFIANPKSEAPQYDAVFASPSIGTGVDIAFPDNAEVFDVVFGFCEAQITTHLEFDQQISRVRHPKEVKV
jgi:hypothetical protein